LGSLGHVLQLNNGRLTNGIHNICMQPRAATNSTAARKTTTTTG
jgi:hypothetical protein